MCVCHTIWRSSDRRADKMADGERDRHGQCAAYGHAQDRAQGFRAAEPGGHPSGDRQREQDRGDGDRDPGVTVAEEESR